MVYTHAGTHHRHFVPRFGDLTVQAFTHRMDDFVVLWNTLRSNSVGLKPLFNYQLYMTRELGWLMCDLSTCDEMNNAIRNHKRFKSTGSDELFPSHFKKVVNCCSKSLLHSFKQFGQTNKFQKIGVYQLSPLFSKKEIGI